MRQALTALLLTACLSTAALAISFDVPTGSQPDDVPDLGLPSSFSLDFGFLTDLNQWFDPQSLEKLNDLVRAADLFRKIAQLPPDASMYDFFSQFTGFDDTYDEAIRSIKGLLDASAEVRKYVDLLDPDGLLKDVLPEDDESATPLFLHSPPLASTGAASTARFHSATYSSPDRLSQVDTHPRQVDSLLPYVEFTSANSPRSRPTISSTPNLPIGQSLKSAWELRQDWEVFEERYFQRVNAEINQPLPYLLYCQAGLTSDLPRPPDVTPGISVMHGDVHPQFLTKTFLSLQYGRYDDRLHLERDDYIRSRVAPLVSSNYFCDGLDFKAPHWIPGIRLNVCGVTVYESDGFPDPSYVNTDELKRGVESAIRHAHTKYLPEYLTSTLASLVPNSRHPLLFPTPWQYPVPTQGSLVYPVSDNDATSIEPIKHLGDTAKRLYGGSVTGNLAHLYYLAPLLKMSDNPSLQTAAKLTALIPILEPGAMAKNAPGAWPLEELKRWLPPSNMVFNETFGYQGFYRVSYEPTATFLPSFMIYDVENRRFYDYNIPDMLFAKALRQPLLFYTGFEVDTCIDYAYTVPYPGAKPVSAFTSDLSYLDLGYPFIGVQARYDWFTNPEGYPIPKVKDAPLIDYWGLPMMEDSLTNR